MKKIISVLLIIALMFAFTACSIEVPTQELSVDKQQNIQTERIMRESNNRIGMPRITNFYEKNLLKDLYELRDDSDLICYAYTVNLEGKYVYQGRCIGYGLPYAVQYSNPDKLGTVEGGEYGALNPYITAQPEPNGLYMPDALSATWLIMINEETGEREPAYFEPTIVVRQNKVPKRLCETWSLPSNY